MNVIGQMDNTLEVKCLNSKGGRGGIEGLQPSLQDRVFDTNGLSFAMTTSFQPNILEIKKMYVELEEDVRVRKYPIDNMQLADLLRKCKSEKKISIEQIAHELDKPKTLVEHWFRRDKGFTIPDDDVWFKLKSLLGINTNKFDDAVMTFETRPGVFEKAQRVYLTDNESPTILAQDDVKICECKEIIKLGQMPGFECENRVYSTDGVCPSIKIGGDPKKIIEVKHLTQEGENECLSRAEQSRAEQSRAEQSSCLIRQATKDGWIECNLPGIADLNYPDSKTRRGRVIERGNICPTLTTESIPNLLEEWTWEIDGTTYLIRIRKLTPRECARLMSFTDDDATAMLNVNSNTQVYKQCGNSIVTKVMEYIFAEMIEQKSIPNDFMNEPIWDICGMTKEEWEKAEAMCELMCQGAEDDNY